MNEKILILNLGGSYAKTLARRIRACGVYCEIAPAASSAQTVASLSPLGLILAGEGGAEALNPEVLRLGLAVLGVGEASLCVARAMGAVVGEAAFVSDSMSLSMGDSPLTKGVGDCERYFDALYRLSLPEGCAVIAGSEDYPAAFADERARLYGMQFLVESNDLEGMDMLMNFCREICGCREEWSIPAFVEAESRRLREKVGEGSALMAMSGGVDSSVCAALVHQALGSRMHYLYVDTGLMRKGDTEMMRDVFARTMGLRLIFVDARERFLQALRGVTDPEEKRRAAEALFHEIFHEEAEKLGHIDYLVQGIIYSDVLGSEEPLLGPEPAHEVEPVRRLFKREVRELGECLGLPDSIIHRQSFPGAGLAVRTLGEVTEEKLTMLREADAIYREEILAAHLDKRIKNYFAVLEESTSTGEHACRYTVALRAVSQAGGSYVVYRLPHDLLERVSERILDEVPGVDRVVYDVTASPRSAVEWE